MLLLLPGKAVFTAVGKQELEPASHRDMLLIPGNSLLWEISEQCEGILGGEAQNCTPAIVSSSFSLGL